MLNNSEQLKKGTILKPQLKLYGYPEVNLYNEEGMKSRRVHRLVAETFIPNPENKPEVNHINGVKDDNRVENLEWVTPKENQIHAYETGLQKTTNFVREVRRDSAKRFNIQKSNPVYQIDKNSNKIVRLWTSASFAEREDDYLATSIRKCCSGKVESHRGYKWKSATAPFTDGFIFIVEGCDATGKSTLIDDLQKKTGFKVVKGSDFSIAEKGVDAMYKYMKEISQSKDILIMDRNFISNLVYAPMYDKNILTERHVNELIDILKRKSITIYLKGNEDIIKDRLSKRGDEYIESSHINSILCEYDNIIPIIKSKMSVIEFDIREYSSFDVSKIVLSIIKNMNLLA